WTLTYYVTGTGGKDGYVAGTNKYADREKANYFDLSSTTYAYTTGCLFYFAKANSNKIENLSKNVIFKVYSAGADGAPDVQLGASAEIPLSQIKTDVDGGFLTEVIFPAPIALPADKKFFVSVDVTNFVWSTSPTGTHDSITLVTSTADDVDPGQGWELWAAPDGWFSMDEAWGGLKIALGIFPYVSNTAAGCNSAAIPVISGVTDINSSQAVVHWYPFANAASYLLRKYAEGTTDYTYYLPRTDTFRKIGGMLPNTYYNVQVKAILNGGTDSSDWSAPVSFVTAKGCPVPSPLKVGSITAACARLNWKLPAGSVNYINIRYRKTGTAVWTEERKKSSENHIVICGLSAATTYEWGIRNLCSSDRSDWVSGVEFTTSSELALSSATTSDNESKVAGNIIAQVFPNPSKGRFSIQAQLPEKATSTTLMLYNNFGAKVWQQDAGNISGILYKSISLGNKLPGGVYLLKIQRNDVVLSQKIVIER
ncbi:MAG TPA: fibronectin type III domain-containing protein, partial [Panacibacter sp.]|nr:fibronectin type III domain-containing protein [Panacibacter sp.]